MRRFVLAVAVVVAAALSVPAARVAQQRAGGTVSSFYDLKTSTLDGKPADLSQYRGRSSRWPVPADRRSTRI
jgi:hypothetical protein